jgi:hypothetical protein
MFGTYRFVRVRRADDMINTAARRGRPTCEAVRK